MSTKTETTRWDPVDYLEDAERVSSYIHAALNVMQENPDEVKLIAAVLCDVARVFGIRLVVETVDNE